VIADRVDDLDASSEYLGARDAELVGPVHADPRKLHTYAPALPQALLLGGTCGVMARQLLSTGRCLRELDRN
jgi:hypothetical protein